MLSRLETALNDRGISAHRASVDAGYPGIIANWRRPQSPTIKTLKAVAGAIKIDPGWLIKEDPRPIDPPESLEAHPQKIDQPDTILGVAYSAWKADDGRLEARFFGALEMLGLIDAVYLLKQDGECLRYEHIGPFYRKTLGFSWWSSAHGKRIADDPDPSFAAWTLAHYERSIRKGEPYRDRCIVVSRYTPVTKGWDYTRLLLPVDGGLVVVNQVN